MTDYLTDSIYTLIMVGNHNGMSVLKPCTDTPSRDIVDSGISQRSPLIVEDISCNDTTTYILFPVSKIYCFGANYSDIITLKDIVARNVMYP